MEARISAFRGSFRRKSGNQMIIVVDGVSDKENAKALVGKTVVWTSPGKNKKQLKGKISAVHGGKGAVRAIFETGMPGQSLGEPVKIE
jgi:large subunit ribosomal protein L35Ae